MEALVVERLFLGGYVAVSLALAVLLLVPRPRRGVNVALAAFLAVQAAQPVLDHLGQTLPDRAWAYSFALADRSSIIAVDILYLVFLRAALDIPLLRPLRTRAAGFALAAASLLVLLPFALPAATHPGFERTAEGEWNAPDGPLSRAVAWIDVTIVVFALVCTLLAVRAAPRGTTARSRAKAYAAAFVLQDLAILTAYSGTYIIPEGALHTLIEGFWFLGTLLTVSILILAYALLRWQLFDFELRLKLTLRRGTVAGIFIAVFFVIAEVASNFLAGQAGYAVGGVAAGLLLFAIRPLERVAEGLADRAMPGVDASPAYAQFKKLEVYRAALESALEDDGRIDERERRMLDTLRAKLAIHAADAAAIEAELVNA